MTQETTLAARTLPFLYAGFFYAGFYIVLVWQIVVVATQAHTSFLPPP